MKNRLITICLLGILALLGQGIAFGAEFMPPYEQPNLYEFVARKLEVTYSSSSFSGEPLLSYRSPKLTRSFRGDQIRVVSTEIGHLVTVTLEQVPDLKTVTFTLLIPGINLPAGDKGVAFKTEAITTTQPTTIAGTDLIQGPLQTYLSRTLWGKASRVVFLQPDRAVVIGEVTLSPTCPGPQRPGQICEQPFAGAVVQIVDSSGMVVETVKTNEKGLFEVSLDAGEYTVHIDSPGILPSCPDTAVRVPEKGSVLVDIVCDTGIR